jgi:hypothetical protein
MTSFMVFVFLIILGTISFYREEALQLKQENAKSDTRKSLVG